MIFIYFFAIQLHCSLFFIVLICLPLILSILKPSFFFLINIYCLGGYVGTDNLCLIEYFGTHDFGWCKTDVMLPYVPGEKFKLSEEKKEAGYSESVTKDVNAIEEADSSFEYFEVRKG